MKIVKIDGGLVFDNGCRLTDRHEQDCCESVYADWDNMQIATYIGANQLDITELDFNVNLVDDIKLLPSIGFIIEATNGVKLFVSCYNYQNGYYPSALDLLFDDINGNTEVIDITECVEDHIC